MAIAHGGGADPRDVLSASLAHIKDCMTAGDYADAFTGIHEYKTTYQAIGRDSNPFFGAVYQMARNINSVDDLNRDRRFQDFVGSISVGFDREYAIGEVAHALSEQLFEERIRHEMHQYTVNVWSGVISTVGLNILDANELREYSALQREIAGLMAKQRREGLSADEQTTLQRRHGTIAQMTQRVIRASLITDDLIRECTEPIVAEYLRTHLPDAVAAAGAGAPAGEPAPAPGAGGADTPVAELAEVDLTTDARMLTELPEVELTAEDFERMLQRYGGNDFAIRLNERIDRRVEAAVSAAVDIPDIVQRVVTELGFDRRPGEAGFDGTPIGEIYGVLDRNLRDGIAEGRRSLEDRYAEMERHLRETRDRDVEYLHTLRGEMETNLTDLVDERSRQAREELERAIGVGLNPGDPGYNDSMKRHLFDQVVAHVRTEINTVRDSIPTEARIGEIAEERARALLADYATSDELTAVRTALNTSIQALGDRLDADIGGLRERVDDIENDLYGEEDEGGFIEEARAGISRNRFLAGIGIGGAVLATAIGIGAYFYPDRADAAIPPVVTRRAVSGPAIPGPNVDMSDSQTLADLNTNLYCFGIKFHRPSGRRNGENDDGFVVYRCVANADQQVSIRGRDEIVSEAERGARRVYEITVPASGSDFTRDGRLMHETGGRIMLDLDGATQARGYPITWGATDSATNVTPVRADSDFVDFIRPVLTASTRWQPAEVPQGELLPDGRIQLPDGSIVSP